MTDMSATAAHDELGAYGGAATHDVGPGQTEGGQTEGGQTEGQTADRGHADTPGQTAAQGETDVLAARHAEARQRAEGGDLTGARTLLEDALAAGELRLGRDHPRLAPLMVDLATIARNLGNLTEAQSQLRRGYGIIVASAGPEHATALSIEGRLAAVTYRLGEPTEPYDWHLADVGARILGPEHPAIRGALQRLSMGYAAAADPEPPTHPGDVGPLAGYAGADHAGPGADHAGPGADYAGPGADYAAPGADYAGGPPPPDTTEPGYAPNYAPSAHAPGVYDRQQRSAGIYVVGPPPRTYQDVEVRQEPPLAAALPRPRRRGHGGGTALVASLGATVLVAGAVVAVQLLGPRGGPDPTTAGPEPVATSNATPTSTSTSSASTAPPTGPLPPTGVRLKDDGGSVTLTWLDPSGGLVPFIVAGGRVGTASTPLETVPTGRTTSTIYGLNIRFDYCFTVAAVWSSDVIAPGIRTCTHRLSTPSSA